ncbi:CRISPR-associated helicase Cas3' [Leptolyngbyaceae cyanobacterium CCMR0082]|uniref:CRISPR-associated helicase Cas3 n=1 Tax=Adonisia turfae CCMR0082 TaxID=2304604 RepID=A0A6M0SID5_9CYAN|nr:CRISPR-associated helicase Cas3' [Adonisia turfae]NEZ68114.1 CRISPR-associated helicase Cas3' [Adonisia turfae CCMR0082]
MAKDSKKRPYDFGRVFFPGKSIPIPAEIRFQPLGNHVGNVNRLVKYWNGKALPDGEASQARILEAAKIHDMGKPQKFQLQCETSPQGKFQKYIYSFRGHRFLAVSKDKWAEKLAIGHHDFSAIEICKDTHQLKQVPQYAALLKKEPLAYAKELYVLEMCDQIEAELACRVMEDGKQAESRTFMDFTITQYEHDSNTYLIDPWPFKIEKTFIELTFHYWKFEPETTHQKALEKHIQKQDASKLGSELDKIVKDWWQKSGLTTKQTIPITIKLTPHTNNPEDSSQSQQRWDAESFYQKLAKYHPNPMQVEMFNAIYDPDDKKHPAIVMKGPTGSGKTEAVLFPALASGYRLFLPLPVRSLLEDQKVRIEGYLKTFSKLYPDREFSLVVDTGSQMHRYIYQNGTEVERKINPRRHLYKGDIILTTIDKMLYRFFAYGDKQKSFTFPLRIHRERTLICFDEAHSYDEISFTNFHSLVTALYEAGQSLVLMTATLPHEYQSYFTDFDLIDYIDDDVRSNALRQFQAQTLNRPHLDKREFVWHEDLQRAPDAPGAFQAAVAKLAFDTFRKRAKSRILLVVQRVVDAVEIYKQLKQNISQTEDEQFLYLYHGRIADQRRPDLYKQVNARDEEGEPYILVTTSAIEVGCDLNAEVLITEICPPENLIQRVGRCNRRGNVRDAQVVVVGNEIPQFANSLDEIGWQTYQNTLRELSGSQFKADVVSQCIRRTQHVDDYRVVEIFSMLYDYIYHADLTCQPTHERGLVPTRSWTPSVEMRIMLLEDEYHSISVPVDRLASNNCEVYAHTHLFERKYDSETTQWQTILARTWGDIYKKQLIVKICPDLSEFIFDDNRSYSYDEELGFVDLPKIFSGRWIQGADVKLKYEYEDNENKTHKIIYSYVNALD